MGVNVRMSVCVCVCVCVCPCACACSLMHPFYHSGQCEPAKKMFYVD